MDLKTDWNVFSKNRDAIYGGGHYINLDISFL